MTRFLVSYCSKTHNMYCKGKNLNQYKGYCFHFSSNGLFTLLDKDRNPLYHQALPLFEKSVSHLIWIFFWYLLIVTFSCFQNIFMACIFIHLFIFGCRLTSLLVKGGVAAIIFPPLWVRLTRKLQKGQGIELLKKYQLENHPGLLVNLALAQNSRRQYLEMKQTLRKAWMLCPNHPVLCALSSFFFAKNPTEHLPALSIQNKKK